jgi:parallel beta-helix repeat protein
MLFSIISFFTPKASAASCTALKNNLVITKNTTLCSGTYSIADSDNNGIIQIKASNITIEGNNVVLNGNSFSGYGIVDKGYSNVTIRHMTISNYYYGMRFESATGLLLENNTIWKNKGESTGFLDINRPLASAYGGGILFNAVSNSTVRNNTLTNQNSGMDVYFGTKNTINNNNGSTNSAWGVRLYASTYNNIYSNQLHHVNRCNNTGCDSAGILLVYGANNNTVTGNNLTYSGDGFFIGNENGKPSNDNVIEGNDASYSPNNAFEATFSTGNVFKSNTATNSNYGFWLGFSHDSRIENNTISNNRTDGVAWEHGRYGAITNNQLVGNSRYGINVTLNPNNTALMAKYPGSEASHHYTITGNTVQDSTRGIELGFTTDSTVTNNKISGNLTNVYFEDNTTVPVGTASATFGNPTIGSIEYTPGDRKIMAKYTLSKDTSVTSMLFYGRWDGNGATGNKGFIYTDNAGSPGALKGVSNILSVDSTISRWWTFTFPAPVNLTAGTYWLGILMEEPGTYINYNPGSANQSGFDRTGESFITGPEDPSSPILFESNNFSLYVPTDVTSPTPTPTPPSFISSNNHVSQNNIVCISNTGKTCQWNAYNNSGKSVDMTNNWWGTTDSAQIGRLIFDYADDASRGPVTFTPYLNAAL